MIVGAGGHGKVVCDLAKNYYSEIIFADDGKVGSEVLGCKVKFSVDGVLNGEKCDFIIAIGNNEIRKKLFLKFLEKGLESQNSFPFKFYLLEESLQILGF